MSLIIEKDYSSIHRKSNHHPGPVSHKAIKGEASSLKADETSGFGAWCSPRGSWERGKKSLSICKMRGPLSACLPNNHNDTFQILLDLLNIHTHTSLCAQTSLCILLCTHNRSTLTLSGRQPSKYKCWNCLLQSTETHHSPNIICPVIYRTAWNRLKVKREDCWPAGNMCLLHSAH